MSGDSALVDTLDHLIVGVRDLDDATAAYRTLLGREPSWRGAHPAMGTANALFRVSNTYLELLAPAGPGGVAEMLKARLDAEGEGLAGFALGTADADACARGLRERGIAANDPQPGEGRDETTGAVRRWRNVMLPPSATRGVLVFAIQHDSPPDALPLAPAWADERAAVEGLDHLVVMSGDLDATRALYGDGFGIRLALDRTFPARNTRLLFFRVGGATLEVGGRPGPAEDPEASDRLWGLAWRVLDVDAIQQRLAAAGCDVSAVRDGHKPGTRVCTLKGTSAGVPTLLIQQAWTPRQAPA